MSEEQPQQPQPEQPQLQTPPIAPSQNATKTRKSSPNRDRSFVKVQTINTLKATIQSLEAVVKKLEAETPQPPAVPTQPQPVAPRKSAVTVKVEAAATTQPDTLVEAPELVIETVSEVPLPPVKQASKTVVEAPELVIEMVSEVPPPPVKQASKTVSAPVKPSLLAQFGSAWETLVGVMRSLLPASANQKLSNTVLSGVIAAIVIIAIGTTLTFLSGKPPEIAVVPSPQPTPINLPVLVAPSAPKPIEIAPAKPLKLTPEQHLIATIQNQVAEITNQFSGGVVKSIQANFPSSLLTVKVADDWYTLPETEQNQLANQMLRQAQKLEFEKIEITNSQDQLIARSPVVGAEMIILERKLKAEG